MLPEETSRFRRMSCKGTVLQRDCLAKGLSCKGTVLQRSYLAKELYCNEAKVYAGAGEFQPRFMLEQESISDRKTEDTRQDPEIKGSIDLTSSLLWKPILTKSFSFAKN